MILKPARESLKIRHPDTLRFLSPEGEPVEPDTYWRRLLACGDVVEVVEIEQIPDSSSEG